MLRSRRSQQTISARAFGSELHSSWWCWSWPVPRATIPNGILGLVHYSLPSLPSDTRRIGVFLHGNTEAIGHSIGDSSIMRIGILSDTHDQVQRTKSAVAMLVEGGAETLIHCGDLTIADVVDECSVLPCYFVFGNCDYDRESLRQAINRVGGTCLERGGLIALGGRRLAVTHGDLDQELRRLAALEPDYLFSGHTHVASDVQKGPTRWINPGALHRASVWTVALLDIASKHVSMLPIVNAKMHH